MKIILALWFSVVSILASEQKQTFILKNKPLDVLVDLQPKQFDPHKGTLTRVEIQSQWVIEDDAPYDVTLGLLLPDGTEIDNHFIDDADRSWGLAVGIDAPATQLSDYIGSGDVPLIVHFTEVSDEGDARAMLELVITYTYTH